jgi:hypothetical protein
MGNSLRLLVVPFALLRRGRDRGTKSPCRAPPPRPRLSSARHLLSCVIFKGLGRFPPAGLFTPDKKRITGPPIALFAFGQGKEEHLPELRETHAGAATEWVAHDKRTPTPTIT